MAHATRVVLTFVAVMVGAGCPPKPPNTGPIEYVGGTDPHPGVPADASPTDERCSEGDKAVAELAELRAEAKASPERVLTRLGLTVDDFEPIAKKLYFKWLEVHPDVERAYRERAQARNQQAAPAAPAAPATVAQPAPSPEQKQRTRRLGFEDGVPVIAIDFMPWCFTADHGVGLCMDTREACSAIANAMGGRGCVPTDREACFTARVRGDKDAYCLRTVNECRSMMAATPAEDVILGCVAFRYSPSPP